MTTTPEWFRKAVSTPSRRGSIVVAGETISFVEWGRRNQDPVLLVHGRGAHARWWDHVAPLLSQKRWVIAIDLSGHGESNWRTSYSLSQWAAEIAALASEVGSPVLVGHSAGGTACALAAADPGCSASGLVLIDSPIGIPLDNAPSGRPGTLTPQRASVFVSREDLQARFKVLPEDPGTLTFIQRHIAEHSIKPVPGGWTWCHDPAVRRQQMVIAEELHPVSCPVALIRADRGFATDESSRVLASQLNPTATITTVIPDAGHHISAGQPIALVSVLRVLLAQWQSRSG